MSKRTQHQSEPERSGLAWVFNWQVSKRAGFSLRRQIVECIRKEHAAGNYPPEGIMPSMVKLANALGINRSHTQKAYQDLCEENAILFVNNGKTRMYIPSELEKEEGELEDHLPIKSLDQYNFSQNDEYRQNILTLGKSGAEMLREVCSKMGKDVIDDQAGNDRITFYDYIFGAGIRFLFSKSYISNAKNACIIPEHAALMKVIKLVTAVGDLIAIASSSDHMPTQTILDMGREPVFMGADQDGLLISNLEKICQKRTLSAVLLRPQSDVPLPNKMSGRRYAELLSLSRKYKFWILLLDDNHLYSDKNTLDPAIATQHVIYLCHFPWFNPLHSVYLVAGPLKLILSLKARLIRTFTNWITLPQKQSQLNASRVRFEKEVLKINSLRSISPQILEKNLRKFVKTEPELIIPEAGVFATIIFKSPLDPCLINDIRGSPLYHKKENLNFEKNKPVKTLRISLLITDWSILRGFFEKMS